MKRIAGSIQIGHIAPPRWVALALLTLAGCQQPSAAAPVASCGDALGRVQQYVLVGDTTPLQAKLQETLPRRDVSYQEVGWRVPNEGAGWLCYVGFDYRVGGERVELGWSYDPATGVVAALDQKTRQMSGWEGQ
jgi:hypothetical protein